MVSHAKVDLHMHSTDSDGRLGPSALVELAYRNGVRRLSLTDHDTTAGLSAAIETGRRLGVEVIPGIELSTDVPANEIHVLGHFLEYEDDAFQARLAAFRQGRVGRAEKMVARLADLGAPVSWDRVRELAGQGSVGRPHVAQALLEAGHVQSMPEAFDRLIGRNGPAYVEREKLTPAEAVDLIHSVRGVAVLAHPIESDAGEQAIADLADAGLDGLECYYQGYTSEQIRELVELAARYALVATGGSDYHGFPMSGMTEVTNEPGSVEIPLGVVDALTRRRRDKFG